LFTRDSSKVRAVGLALGALLATYAVVAGALHAMAVHVEEQGESYPWRSEDYLRYLIPTLLAAGGEHTLLIAGPSEAREDLLHEEFAADFPHLRVVQGGLSLGKFDDLLIALDYWEATLGSAAIPRLIVLGVTPRFVGNLPREESPLAATIDRYSARYSIDRTPAGGVLVRKSWFSGVVARGRFHMKQPARYRAALCGLAVPLIGRSPAFTGAEGGSGPAGNGVLDGWRARIDRCRSPYKFRLNPPMAAESVAGWIRDPGSFWVDVHRWEPEPDSAMVAGAFARLRGTADRLGTDLFVVNLPEHPVHAPLYRPGAYDAYLRLVRASLAGVPFLDLRTLLPQDRYHDAAHATWAGALVVTDTTIRALRGSLPLHAAVRPGSGAPSGGPPF
jgi:hypothetical protein